MPHYSYRKTFAAGGSSQEPEELEMLCSSGILCDVIIDFPPGCHGTTHVRVSDGLHQVFPTNAEDTYALDGVGLQIRDEYELDPATRKLYLQGWNEGVYAHTISVAFRIRLPQRLTKTEELLQSFISLWSKLTGMGGEGV